MKYVVHRSKFARLAALGQKTPLRPDGDSLRTSGMPRYRTTSRQAPDRRCVPCVDGSGLASVFFASAALVGAAMCSAFERGTLWPLAIMPSADQVPVKSPHSTMQWHMWVVLIAGSTGSALRAVRPFQPSHHVGCPTRSFKPSARRVADSGCPSSSGPRRSARACWRGR